MSELKCPNIKIYKCSDGFVTGNAQVAKSHEANIKSKSNSTRTKGLKMEPVKEIKQYQATDGTCFDTREEAESYEEMLQNPHFKKVQQRIEKLESDVLALQAKVATLDWRSATQINRPPYQRPDIMLFDQKAYNPATGN